MATTRPTVSCSFTDSQIIALVAFLEAELKTRSDKVFQALMVNRLLGVDNEAVVMILASYRPEFHPAEVKDVVDALGICYINVPSDRAQDVVRSLTDLGCSVHFLNV